MIRVLTLVFLLGMCSAAPQFFIPANTALPHPAVLENDAQEALLPDHFRNDFYKNPHFVAALAEPSWFGYKEGQVIDRETDRIPREQVYHLLHNAGKVRR